MPRGTVLISEYVSFEKKLGEDYEVHPCGHLMGPPVRGLLGFKGPREDR